MKYILLITLFILQLLANTDIKKNYYVYSDDIMLSDVIKNVKKDVKIYSITEGRYTKKIKSKDLIKLLKKYGYTNYHAKHAYVQFTKQSPIDTSRIEQEIRDFYTKRYKDIKIKNIEVHPRGYIDSLFKEYSVKIKERNALHKNGIIAIKSQKNREIFFNYSIDANVHVYKTKKEIKRYSELSIVNCKKTTLHLDKFKAMPLQELKSGIFQSKHHIKKDTILTTRDISKLFLVKKGSNVNIFLYNANMSITFSAKALQNGSYGDIISVIKNNGKRMKVLVIGKHKAEVR